MKKIGVVGGFIAGVALVVVTALPAAAITYTGGAIDCGPGLGRPAVYAGATGTLSAYQSWTGGSHTEDWSNGSSIITRTKVAPVGVRKTGTNNFTSTSTGTWSQTGKDCRFV